MPIREYECDVCGRRFEKIQKFSDPPIEVCPTCGGHVHKMISSPAFQFKGSGWYVTDYARKDSGGGKTDSDSSEKSASKDSKDSKDSKGSKESKDSKDSKDSAGSDKDSGSKKNESTTTSTTEKSKNSSST
jgi:putative FmdB family regulatory protein